MSFRVLGELELLEERGISERMTVIELWQRSESCRVHDKRLFSTWRSTEGVRKRGEDGCASGESAMNGRKERRGKDIKVLRKRSAGRPL